MKAEGKSEACDRGSALHDFKCDPVKLHTVIYPNEATHLLKTADLALCLQPPAMTDAWLDSSTFME